MYPRISPFALTTPNLKLVHPVRLGKRVASQGIKNTGPVIEVDAMTLEKINLMLVFLD